MLIIEISRVVFERLHKICCSTSMVSTRERGQNTYNRIDCANNSIICVNNHDYGIKVDVKYPLKGEKRRPVETHICEQERGTCLRDHL